MAVATELAGAREPARVAPPAAQAAPGPSKHRSVTATRQAPVVATPVPALAAGEPGSSQEQAAPPDDRDVCFASVLASENGRPHPLAEKGTPVEVMLEDNEEYSLRSFWVEGLVVHSSKQGTVVRIERPRVGGEAEDEQESDVVEMDVELQGAARVSGKLQFPPQPGFGDTVLQVDGRERPKEVFVRPRPPDMIAEGEWTPMIGDAVEVKDGVYWCEAVVLSCSGDRVNVRVLAEDVAEFFERRDVRRAARWRGPDGWELVSLDHAEVRDAALRMKRDSFTYEVPEDFDTSLVTRLEDKEDAKHVLADGAIAIRNRWISLREQLRPEHRPLYAKGEHMKGTDVIHFSQAAAEVVAANSNALKAKNIGDRTLFAEAKREVRQHMKRCYGAVAKRKAPAGGTGDDDGAANSDDERTDHEDDEDARTPPKKKPKRSGGKAKDPPSYELPADFDKGVLWKVDGESARKVLSAAAYAVTKRWDELRKSLPQPLEYKKGEHLKGDDIKLYAQAEAEVWKSFAPKFDEFGVQLSALHKEARIKIRHFMDHPSKVMRVPKRKAETAPKKDAESEPAVAASAAPGKAPAASRKAHTTASKKADAHPTAEMTPVDFALAQADLVGLTCVAWSRAFVRDGDRRCLLAAGTRLGHVAVWELVAPTEYSVAFDRSPIAAPKLVSESAMHGDVVTALAWETDATDGLYLVSGCADGSVRVWAWKAEPSGGLPATFAHSATLFLADGDPVTCLATKAAGAPHGVTGAMRTTAVGKCSGGVLVNSRAAVGSTGSSVGPDERTHIAPVSAVGLSQCRVHSCATDGTVRTHVFGEGEGRVGAELHCVDELCRPQHGHKHHVTSALGLAVSHNGQFVAVLHNRAQKTRSTAAHESSSDRDCVVHMHALSEPGTALRLEGATIAGEAAWAVEELVRRPASGLAPVWDVMRAIRSCNGDAIQALLSTLEASLRDDGAAPALYSTQWRRLQLAACIRRAVLGASNTLDDDGADDDDLRTVEQALRRSHAAAVLHDRLANNDDAAIPPALARWLLEAQSVSSSGLAPDLQACCERVHMRPDTTACPVCGARLALSSPDGEACGDHRVERCAVTLEPCASAELWVCSLCARPVETPAAEPVPQDAPPRPPCCPTCGLLLVRMRGAQALAPRLA